MSAIENRRQQDESKTRKRKVSELLWVGVVLTALLTGMIGCSNKIDTSYTIPSNIYGVNLEQEAFVAPEFKWDAKYNDQKISAGEMLCQDDFKFRINKDLTLRLGEKVDTVGMTKIKDYKYANGVVTEYSESTGNYKILTTGPGGANDSEYLLAALTISSYVTTGRGLTNGMTKEALMRELKNNSFESKQTEGQEDQVYTLGNCSLIVTMKYDVVRSLQLILNNY